jgi:phosphoglycerate dehydrogenase-like enzyme
MTTSSSQLRVVAATPISDALIRQMTAIEPRINFVVDHALLPTMRFPGDHAGDPSFRRNPDQQRRFEELLDGADALYGIPDESPAALARTITSNHGLRWVQTMAAGGGGQIKAAGLDADSLLRVAFSTSAGVHAQPLAEYALFGLLAGAKSLPRLNAQQGDRRWSDRWTMGLISEQSILIVGMGSIGQATAEKLKALGAHVVGTSRRHVSIPFVDEVIHPDDIATAIGRFDGVVVTLPGTSSTENLIGDQILSMMKPGATLVSVGRGSVIDEIALVAALHDQRIGLAVLDVFAQEPLSPTSPLWALPNVIISPHTAALNTAEDRLIAELFANNAQRLLDGESLMNRVDTVEFY